MGKIPTITPTVLIVPAVIIGVAYVGYHNPIDLGADGAVARAAIYAGLSLIAGYLTAKICR